MRKQAFAATIALGAVMGFSATLALAPVAFAEKASAEAAEKASEGHTYALPPYLAPPLAFQHHPHERLEQFYGIAARR